MIHWHSCKGRRPGPWSWTYTGLLGWITVLGLAPAPALAAPADAQAQGRELWVDRLAAGGGDGTRAHPWRELAVALEGSGARTVHLEPGLYRGPWKLPAETRLVGPGQRSAEVVLYAEDLEPVVLPAGHVTLESLTIQGGSWGLEAHSTSSEVELRDVHFSGSRRGCVDLQAGALTADSSDFEAGVSETVGLRLSPGTRATVRRSVFRGPFRRGVELLEKSELELVDSRFEGAVEGVHSVDASVALTRVHVTGGRGAGLLIAGGALSLEHVLVTGHEYGLLASRGAYVHGEHFTSLHPERAGVALVKARGELDGLVVQDAGDHGGVEGVSAELVLTRFRIVSAKGYGVHLVGGKLRAEAGRVSHVLTDDGSSGDGLDLRGTDAEVRDVQVRGAAGACVRAAEGAHVTLRDVDLAGCAGAGVLAETLGQVRGMGVRVSDSPSVAVAVPGEAHVDLDALTSERNTEGALWVECVRGADVRLSRVRGDSQAGIRGPPCVEEAR